MDILKIQDWFLKRVCFLYKSLKVAWTLTVKVNMEQKSSSNFFANTNIANNQRKTIVKKTP